MPNTVANRLNQFVGQIVVVEGTFPIPLPNGQIAYAPAKGKLVAVFDDGFELQDVKDPNEIYIYVTANIRDVYVAIEEKRVVPVEGRIHIPSPSSSPKRDV